MLDLKLFLYLAAVWIIVSSSFFISSESGYFLLLVKWTLLAASEQEINRERQRLDSFLSCAVTILGQVSNETSSTSCVCCCFPVSCVGAWKPCVSLCAPKVMF